jgi:hypothetical protein
MTRPSVREPPNPPCDGKTWRLGVATRRWHVLPEHGGWRERRCDGGVQMIWGACTIQTEERRRRRERAGRRISLGPQAAPVARAAVFSLGALQQRNKPKHPSKTNSPSCRKITSHYHLQLTGVGATSPRTGQVVVQGEELNSGRCSQPSESVSSSWRYQTIEDPFSTIMEGFDYRVKSW